jgi:iron complex outermembrane receptor protein
VALIQVGGVSGGVGTTIEVLKPGVAMNSFYVCQQAFTSGKPVEGKYIALDGTTVTGCDSRALRPYHSPEPNWIFGHTSNLAYHSFDLSFTLRAYTGNYVYNNVASQGAYQALTGGGSPSNTSSSVLRTGFVVPQYLSDYFVEDASFLRMDNVTLGYAFRWMSQPVRLFVTVQNAFTITGYKGVDPTAGLGGIDNNIYPRSRTVTGGLSVRF